MELRLVIATVMRKFDVGLAPGWDVGEWDRGLIDRFALACGELPVVVASRA